MRQFIYALADPQTEEVRYIGITDNIRRRIRAHLSCNEANEAKNNWMRQLTEETLIPSLKILEIVYSREVAIEKEQKWIKHYLDLGAKLLNIQTNILKQAKQWWIPIIEAYPDLLEYPEVLEQIKQDESGYKAIKEIFEMEFSDEEIEKALSR